MNRISSSDYITTKRQRSIYREVTENAKLINSTNPSKENGKQYNKSFNILPPLNEPIGNCSGCCLKTARNYALLTDYTKGRTYQNWLCNKTNYCNKPITWLFNKTDAQICPTNLL
jgi:hypothetical protein